MEYKQLDSGVSEYCKEDIDRIDFMVLCGKIKLSSIPVEHRVSNYSLYKYALRHAQETRNEEAYDEVLCLLESDSQMVKDKVRKHNLKRILQDYQERKKHYDFIPLCDEKSI